jgi:multiple sugar transport system permease protein
MAATWAEVRPTAPPVGRTRRTLLRGLPIVPSVVLLAVFLAGPIAYCIYAAFTNMALTGQVGTQFIGFANFTRAFSDPAFYNSVWLTVVFTLVSAIIGQNVLGMVLALLMRSGHAVARALTCGSDRRLGAA